MKINFSYKSTKYVIRRDDFLEQIGKHFNKKYFYRSIDMGIYIADIFVTDNSIKTIEYVGEELSYYKITYKNGMQTSFTKNMVVDNPDFLQAKIIENNLVVLEMPHYNYLSFISGYSVYTQDKTIIIDLENNPEILIEKLQKIFRQEIVKITVCIDTPVNERVYNGDIELTINGKKYKTTDKLIYTSNNYKYVYIPDKKTVLILK